MTPDFETQLSSIDTQEPSIHKIDKKLSILIFQVLDVLQKHNDIDTRLKCVETKQSHDGAFAKGVAWICGILFTGLSGWLATKK